MRSFDILELFLTATAPLSASQITQMTGLPRASVHELLTTLAQRQYLSRVAGTGHYQLGLRLFQLGSLYGERLDLAQVGALVAARVAAQCDETVHVAVRDGTNVVYVAKIDSTRAVRMVSAVGRTLPAHCTAVGKALLASLTEEELSALYPEDTPLGGLTKQSITDVARLRAQLREIAERGVACEERESNPDVCCISAPVRDHAHRVVAAISLSVPTTRWQQTDHTEWRRLIVSGARAMSEQLGENREATKNRTTRA